MTSGAISKIILGYFVIKGGPGTDELVFIINEGLRRKKEWGIPFYCTKLGIEAVFDSVCLQHIYDALRYHGVDLYLSDLIIRELGRSEVTWDFAGIRADRGQAEEWSRAGWPAEPTFIRDCDFLHP